METTERELREWHERQRATWRSRHLKLLGPLRFWGPDSVIHRPEVESLDIATRCEDVALTAASRFGFAVATGWVVSPDHPPVMHFWNLTTSGEIVDAANARRRASGYLGGVLPDGVLAYLTSSPLTALARAVG